MPQPTATGPLIQILRVAADKIGPALLGGHLGLSLEPAFELAEQATDFDLQYKCYWRRRSICSGYLDS